MQNLAQTQTLSKLENGSQQDFGHSLQVRLAQFNRKRLNPALPHTHWAKELRENLEFQLLETELIEGERARIQPIVEKVPTQPSAFIKWFENLEKIGPGQHDPLFAWLAHHASESQMKWFLTQEVAGEAGFEDLVALSQIKIPPRAKMEMAKNYWDEMGRGQEKGMHGPMLQRLADEIKIKITSPQEIVTESLALANLLVGFAFHRRYAYHSIGALGAIELTAPGRAKCVYEGLKRLGLKDSAQYYLLHSTLDIKHSKDWNAEVLYPLVSSNPAVAKAIAEGAWLRLEFGARCFRRYKEVLLKN